MSLLRPRSHGGRARPAVLALEDRLAPAVFNIPAGDIVAFAAAINASNVNNQPDVINLAAGSTYTFPTPPFFGGQEALPPVVRDFGNPVNSLTVNGNGATLQRSAAAGTPATLRAAAHSPLNTTITPSVTRIPTLDPAAALSRRRGCYIGTRQRRKAQCLADWEWCP